MQFEWDENKNQSNVSKHGVSFSDATKAFEDINRKILFNGKHSVDEKRFYCLGRVDGRVLTVRFTIRGQKMRIIGAGFWREGKKNYEKE
jgi:uncharacterized DUF497 family protein